MTPNKNEKSFKLINKVSQSFNLIIANFDFVSTLLTIIRLRLRLTFVYTSVMKFVTTINLKRVRLIISQVKLIQSITQTINVKRIRLIMSSKAIMKAISTFSLRLRIGFISSAIQKLTTTMKTGILRITLDPTIAQFFTLGDFDPEILGDLDVLTLGDMDYT